MYFNAIFNINYVAVFVSALLYFVIGSIWFSAIFGNVWKQELKLNNIILQEPTHSALITKMVLAFIANIVTCIAIAFLVNMINSTTLGSGFILGVITSLGFAITTVGSVFIWENRSVKFFLIDIGYPVLGIIAASILLSIWR